MILFWNSFQHVLWELDVSVLVLVVVVSSKGQDKFPQYSSARYYATNLAE